MIGFFRRARRHFAGRRCGHHYTADKVRAIGGEHARGEVAPGVTDHHDRACVFMFDDCCDVPGKVVYRQVFHRPFALPYATRLGPEDAEPIHLKIMGDLVIIASRTPQ